MCEVLICILYMPRVSGNQMTGNSNILIYNKNIYIIQF